MREAYRRLGHPNGAASVANIYDALAAAAGENDLPVISLNWQESCFDPTAVSRAGAQGGAQSMPATANARGLADPFDPIEAIAHSAKALARPAARIRKLRARGLRRIDIAYLGVL